MSGFSAFRMGALATLLLTQACLPDASVPPAQLAGCERFQVSPVLFVHGSGLDANSWVTMRSRLKQRGFDEDYLLAVHLVPNDGDNIVAAETLVASAADGLLEQATWRFAQSGCAGRAPQKIAITAHSMGAFSGRWYAALVAPAKVSTLIAIAGANHGTDALCGLSGIGNRQMCPAFMADGPADAAQLRLNGSSAVPRDQTPYGTGTDRDARYRVLPDADRRIRYWTIRLAQDRWITPAESAVLDGAGDPASQVDPPASLVQTSPGNFVFTGNDGHDDLPANDAIFELVATLLLLPTEG